MNNLDLSPLKVRFILCMLLLVMPIVAMAVDLIAPSLPAIAKGLQVSNGVAKNIISLYLLGYALGNCVTGFLTDAMGRKRILRVGLILFVLASLLPVLFPHIKVVLFARLLQGLSIGGVAVIVRTILSDLLSGEQLVRWGILLGTMFGLGPILGPLIGGYLQFYFGWQACFLFFAVILSVLSVVLFILVPETHFNTHALKLQKIKQDVSRVLKDKRFMGLTLITGVVYSLIISFNTLGPFLVQNTLHYSSVFFGHLALMMGLAFLTATFVCQYLLRSLTVERVLLIFIHVFLVVAGIGIVLGYTIGNNVVLLGLVSSAMFFSCGLMFPMSAGKVLSLFRDIAGSATAVMYLINILMTSFSAFLLSFVRADSVVHIFWVYGILLALCALFYWRVFKR